MTTTTTQPRAATPALPTKAAPTKAPSKGPVDPVAEPADPTPSGVGIARRAADDVKDGERLKPGIEKPGTAPNQPGPAPAPEKPTTTDQIEQARATTDPAERSRQFDAVATQLEQQGPPKREDYRLIPNGRVMEMEYADARAYYYEQLEEAQQGAKPERERAMREDLAKTATGREMLEFERRAGVPIKVLTDREWRAAGHGENVAAFSAGDEGLTFRVTSLNAHVYTHEMTHQVDSKTGVLAEPGDTRTREQVIAEATDKYEQYGLDPAEVPALVDATYHQGDHLTLSHTHTRLAEARLHRQEAGGEPMDDAELRQVLALALPREQDNRAIDVYDKAAKTDQPAAEATLRRYAVTRGIDVDGLSVDDVKAKLNERRSGFEAGIVALEQEGATAHVAVGGKAGGIGGIGGIGGLGNIVTDAAAAAAALATGAAADTSGR